MASHGASGCRDDEMPEGTVRGRDAGASRCRNSEEIGSEQDGCPGASMARGDGRAVVWKVALGAMMTKMRFSPPQYHRHPPRLLREKKEYLSFVQI